MGAAYLVAAVACSSNPEWTLPDRDDPAVQAEEARLADVVEGSGVVWDDFGKMSCEVRLLGSEGDASFVWAECGVGRPVLSVPLRIEGEDVTEALVADHEAARGTAFTKDDWEVLDASNLYLYLCAYGARCQHSDISTGAVGDGVAPVWAELLRARGRQLARD